ncbi:hypothetical protein HMSSN139_20120 [Paenibacillus sp. HMSSN-139]|nr:hypothetical protein HMSSN139_20120 [Paenibacillus sp. HMSSN-139]
MKFKAWNLGKMRRNLLHVLALGRTFLLLSVMSVIFFIMLGVLGIAEKNLNTSPVSSMKGLAASLSSGFSWIWLAWNYRTRLARSRCRRSRGGR